MKIIGSAGIDQIIFFVDVFFNFALVYGILQDFVFFSRVFHIFSTSIDK
jgi:hypothetical protein